MKHFNLGLKIAIKVVIILLLVRILLGGGMGFSLNTNWLDLDLDDENTMILEQGSAQIEPGVIREVDITFVSGDVTVLPYDGESLELNYKGGTVDCAYQLEGDTLTIFPKLENKIGVFSLGADGRDGDLTLMVPQTMTNLDVEINVVSGEANVGIQGNELDVNSVSGEVTVGNFTDIDCETVSGDVKVIVEEGYRLRSLDCETVSGNLTLQGDCNYYLNMESVSGKHMGSAHNASAGAKVDIKFESVSGNMG